MKYLLTSAGIRNPSIHAALTGLLDRPIAECNALAITTASYPLPGGAQLAWNFISGQEPRAPLVELGWKSVGVLELTALPSVDRSRWLPMVDASDVLLVNGGDPMFLHYWMRQSGLADMMPNLSALYVGLSAGSMVITPRIGMDFVGWTPPDAPETGIDETLGLVDFSIFPHLDNPDLPENIMAAAERWAETLPNPAYVIDDETAIVVHGYTVEVVSEGQWRYLAR